MADETIDNTVDAPPVIYNYDATTGEFLSEGVADANPVNIESWLIPNNATLIAPPQEMEGNIRVFSNGAWGYVKWNRPQDGITEEPHGPGIQEIIFERAIRLASGFSYDFGVDDPRGVHDISTTDEDMRGWEEVTKIANALIMTGQPDEKIGIFTDTGPVQVTATEWQKILIRANQVRQPIYAASFALQAMWPNVPADYRDAKYWPDEDQTEYVEEYQPVVSANNAPWISPEEAERLNAEALANAPETPPEETPQE